MVKARTDSERKTGKKFTPRLKDLLSLSPEFKAEYEHAALVMEGAALVREMRSRVPNKKGSGVGITQQELAMRIGVSQTRISTIESGRGRDGVSYALLKRIANACDIEWPAPLPFEKTGAVVSKSYVTSKAKMLPFIQLDQQAAGYRGVLKGKNKIPIRKSKDAEPVHSVSSIDYDGIAYRPVSGGKRKPTERDLSVKILSFDAFAKIRGVSDPSSLHKLLESLADVEHEEARLFVLVSRETMSKDEPVILLSSRV